MAQQIGLWCRDLQPAGVINGLPGNHFELNDQSGSSSTVSFATKAKFVRAVLFLRSFGSSTTPAGTASFSIQGANDAAMSVNVTNIDCCTITGGGTWSMIIEGFVPRVDGTYALNFFGIKQTSGASASYDTIIDGL